MRRACMAAVPPHSTNPRKASSGTRRMCALANRSRQISEMDEMKRPGPASMAKQRELIELAKNSGSGCDREKDRSDAHAILESTRRLGISMKGGNEIRRRPPLRRP